MINIIMQWQVVLLIWMALLLAREQQGCAYFTLLSLVAPHEVACNAQSAFVMDMCMDMCMNRCSYKLLSC